MKSAIPWLLVLSQLCGARVTCCCSSAELVMLKKILCVCVCVCVCHGNEKYVVKILMELSVRNSGVWVVTACQEPSHSTRMSM